MKKTTTLQNSSVVYLEKIGWEKYRQRVTLPEGDFEVGRVAVENKTNYLILTARGECEGILRGKFLSQAAEADYPRVGDWVRISVLADENKAVIDSVLPRLTKISRKSSGDDSEQVIVANVDIVFIVQSLPGDFNLKRLERYLVIARQSGARPVVILNKVDLNETYEELIRQAEAILGKVPIIAVSAKTSHGMGEVRKLLKPGLSFVFLGSSGVGKSSIINNLARNDTQAVQEVRLSDDTGRHTTTKREMVVLPDGSILIDTPGMRELSLWADEKDINGAFGDFDDLALGCKFSRCDHDKSAGCAVKAALVKGFITAERYQNYIKLQKERAYLETKFDRVKKSDKKAQDKKIHKGLKAFYKHKT